MNATSSQTEFLMRQEDQVRELVPKMSEYSPKDAAKHLFSFRPKIIINVLEQLNPVMRQNIFDCFPEKIREELLRETTEENRIQWSRNSKFKDGTVGRLMEPALAIFRADQTISEAIEELRPLVKRAFIVYGFVTDEDGRLTGVVAMRELALGSGEQKLEEIMVRKPFYLTPGMSLIEAMRKVVTRHFPVYPVCDSNGQLIGVIRGQTLFEAQAIELSAQAGSMVGVEKEERATTAWPQSLKSRHPWLQLNLAVTFLAAGVIGVFSKTLQHLVILTIFLPVLSALAGNAGFQALAVTLRGMTLGDLLSMKVRKLFFKEALLGLLNGALVGLSAGAVMFVIATKQHNPKALFLGGIVVAALMISLVISGIVGVLVPLSLKRFGADPATASSIFLTAITDVVSFSAFLGLASLLV